MKNKISRLVVPFVLVYLFWNTPIKIFSGYYSQSENIWKDILMQMFIPTNMYLWYLEALFFDFVLAYLLCKYTKKTWMINTTSFAVYMAVLFLERATAVTTLFGNPLRYLLWFVFGMNLNKYGKVAKNHLNRFKWGGGTAPCGALDHWLLWTRIPSTFGLACKRFIFGKCGNSNCVGDL